MAHRIWADVARSIASWEHAGTKDKAGNPYFWHCDYVSGQVSDHGELYEIVGLLHDVVEDTNITLEELRTKMAGYPKVDRMIEAVDAITRRSGETYFEYIERVKTDSIATVVKLADLEQNMQSDRYGNGKVFKVSESLLARYKKAEAILKN